MLRCSSDFLVYLVLSFHACCLLVLQRSQRRYHSLELELIRVKNKYDQRVSDLEADLAKSKVGLSKHFHNANKTKRSAHEQIQELTAENIKLDEQRKKCAEMAKNLLADFKILKEKAIEAIDFKNSSSYRKEFNDKVIPIFFSIFKF